MTDLEPRTAGALAAPDDEADPACPRTPGGPPTSTRRPRSAPSVRSPPSSCCPWCCVVLFVVAYFTIDIGDNHDTAAGLGASTLALGGTLGLALLFIGIGMIQWARKLMGDHEIVEMRHPAVSSDEDRDEGDRGPHGRGRGVGHRPPSPPAQHHARGAGPGRDHPDHRAARPRPAARRQPEHTAWRAGMRVVVDVLGTPIRPEDLEFGTLVNCQPADIYALDEEGEPLYEGVDLHVAKAKASLIIVRMEPEAIIPGPGRENWSRGRHPGLLQDLHPRRVPDLPLRAHHAPRAVPLPPVDLRPQLTAPR